MEQIREQMADIVWGINNGEAGCLSKAARILSITLRRGGGVCPRCDGLPHGRYWLNQNRAVLGKCLDCDGTGKLPVEEKSIKDILREGGWE